MSSTKGLKEKSSSTKFWKKFSLNKKSSVTVSEQQHVSSTAIHDVADDRSVKSKRLSIGSLRKRQSISNSNNYYQQQEPLPPAVPDTNIAVAQQQHRHQLVSSQPPSLTDTSAATVALSVKEPGSMDHVITNSPGDASHDLGSTVDSPVPTANIDNKKIQAQHQSEPQSELTTTATTTSVQSNSASRLKSPDSRSTRPRYNSNPTNKPPTASRLAAPSTTFPPKKETPVSSTSGNKKPSFAQHSNSSSDRLPRPTHSKSTQSIRSTSSSSSPSSSTSTSSHTNNTNTNNNNASANKTAGTGSRLRKPSQIPGKSTLPQLRAQETPTKSSSNSNNRNDTLNVIKKKKSAASIASSIKITPSKSSRSTDTVDNKSSDPEQIIRQLKEDLEKERSVIKVLQGQKEAVAKDLDYFSQMMDELMEEKEQLQQKYDEEKQNNKHREEDLNELLNKLKSSNENARDRSFEADQWKMDLEKIREEARGEQDGLRAQVKDKNKEIKRLRSELSNANDQISTLKKTMDSLIQAQYSVSKGSTNSDHNINSPQPIETPTASPNIQHANIPNRYTVHDDPPQSDNPQSPIPDPHYNTSMPPSPTTTQYQTSMSPSMSPSIPIKNSLYNDYEKNTSAYNTPQSSFNSQATTTSPNEELDRQLRKLTKEKEKLQSDYSKIPLSGGGPMSRRRKEELEDMLDEIDSQLSKVKQKIKRS
ncbi:hypothetical protein INT45_009502 [Circinella minor]|uniref:Enkurin domain-containing protein n=1 Tax=Circinella minor TaxID=1195481 RepID=A0A8H7VQM0_9FUNG|nr:hypothetical protein INT45_009502 [Circinella minor]